MLDSTFYPDNLFAGDKSVDTIDVTIVSNVKIKRGDVLGRITKSVPTTGTAGGSNTGNGLCTAVEGRRYTKKGAYTITSTEAVTNGGTFQVVNPDLDVLGDALVNYFVGTGTGTITKVQAKPLFNNSGYYRVKCYEAVTNGGKFYVYDPLGNVIGDFEIPAGAGALYAFDSDEIAFTITEATTDFVLNDEFFVAPFEHDEISLLLTDGSTDFVVGDVFTVTVAVGSNECKIVNSALSDGAQTAYCIASEDVDTTSTGSAAAAKSVGYRSGQFNERFLRVGGADDISDHVDTLRTLGIYTDPSVPAGDGSGF